MILEVAILEIKENLNTVFENAFEQAKSIISVQKGFIHLDLHKCIEKENQYILLVKWETLEDHEMGFRQSTDYIKWKNLLHHFYDPFPTVEHYRM